MSRTTTISQEDENWIPIRLPFTVVGEHTQSREGAVKMTTMKHYMSSGYTIVTRELSLPILSALPVVDACLDHFHLKAMRLQPSPPPLRSIKMEQHQQ